MKHISFIISFLLLSSLALADISVDTDKQFYNLGDFIEVEYNVSTDADLSGLTKLSLVCSDYDIEFYTLPTSLFAGDRQTVSVPGLRIASDMYGRCYIDADVSSFDNTVNFDAFSDIFNVTDNLSVTIDLDKEFFDPGEDVFVSGFVGKSHDSRATVQLTFSDAVYIGNVVDNSFAYNIMLPSNIKTGRHLLDFFVNDTYGNSGLGSATFTVEAVPTNLIIDIINDTVKPGDILLANVTLFDQAKDLMDNPVKLTLIDAADSENVILSSSGITPAIFELEIDSTLPPGTYKVQATSAGLLTTSILTVETVEKVTIKFDNRTLTVINTGNVDYSKELIISLKGTEEESLLVKEIDLSPEIKE